MQNTNLVPLVVADIAIRQDSHGRYCLNDLHKASGGEAKHRPSLWSENKQTKDLVAAIEAEAGIPALVMIHGGMTSGTYVAKDLVYSYAMWISPAFSLKVIRAYDRLVSGEAPMPFSIDNLPPAIARQVGGIIKAVVHKEVTEALSQSLPSLIHGDVIRDIRVMLDGLGDDADLRHVRETKDSRGYTSMIEPPKDLTITLVPATSARSAPLLGSKQRHHLGRSHPELLAQ